MRSNDIVLGFTYDIFAFTMFQEMMANELGLELGTYYHNVGSMHIYQKNFNLLDKHTFIKSVPMQRNCMCLDQYEDLVAYERLLRNANSNAYMLEKFADYNDDVKYSFEPDYLDILKYALVLWAIKRKIKNPIDRIQMANKVINEARLIDENYVDLLVNGCNMFGNDDIKIIVEGIDGAGKSTLVNALSEALAKEGIMANAQHCKKPTNNFRYFDNYFNSTMNDANVIFDRFFFTEWIYSIVMDRERFLSPRDAQELMGICMDKKFTFVFFVFDDEGLKEVCSRMDKQDYEDFASNDRAYRQNCFYETTTKLLQSKGANVIVIDNPNYDVQEQIIRIIGRDALC
jgi:thymidylate kinase